MAADKETRINELSAESARLKGQVTRLEKEIATTRKQKKTAGDMHEAHLASLSDA